MQITIDNQRFRVDEDGERLVIYDSHDVVIGYATDEAGATAICEGVAWRRRVDGKVDEKPIAVDETQRIIECELCKHNSTRLVITGDNSAVLKRECALNVRYDGKSHCESFAMKENINDSIYQQRDH